MSGAEAQKRVVRGALGYSFAQRYGESALRIVGLIVLARFVGPEGFGVFAVAYGVVSLAAGSVRGSISAFVVRADGEGEPGLGTPFLVCAAASLVVGGALVAGAPMLARLVGAPDAAGPFRILALVFLFTPLEAVFGGLLSRRMAFGRIGAVGFGAVLIGTLVSIGLAAQGLNETALAIGALAELSLLGVGAALLAPGGWALLRAPGAPAHEIVRFCLRVGSAKLVSGAGKLTATLATARFLGPAAVGLYDRARRVTWTFGDLVLNAVTPVILPALSEARRGGASLAGPYVFKLQAISLAAWPFFAALAVSAEPVVLLLLGPDWRAAVPLVQAACLFGVPMPYHTVDTAFLIASGRERAYLRIQVIAQVISLVLIVAAAQVGVAWVLVAHAAGKSVKGWMTTRVLRQAFGIPAGAAFEAVGASALVAAGTASAAWAVQALRPPAADAGEAFVLVALIGAACAGALAVLIVATRHPARDELTRLIGHGADHARAVVGRVRGQAARG